MMIVILSEKITKKKKWALHPFLKKLKNRQPFYLSSLASLLFIEYSVDRCQPTADNMKFSRLTLAAHKNIQLYVMPQKPAASFLLVARQSRLKAARQFFVAAGT